MLTYGVLLGGSVLTARRAGPGGIRLLFRGLLRWRIGWANAAVVVAAIPLATIGVAALTGTYVTPEDGWLPVISSYLVAPSSTAPFCSTCGKRPAGKAWRNATSWAATG